MRSKLLVADWKNVLMVSASFWAQIAGLMLSIGVETVYVTTGRDTDPSLVWWIGNLLLVFGTVGRLCEQNNKPWVEWVRTAGVFAVILLLSLVLSSNAFAHNSNESKAVPETSIDIAVPLIARWEGLRLDAYLDVVGVPTICYGSTRGIKLGMTHTQEQCDHMLREEVAEYREGWLSYVEHQALIRWLPAKREAAYTSLAYNVGIRAAGKSTATRRLNDGDIRGGCRAIGWWNKAGGRVIRGLVNRRTDETKLCLAGT